MRRKFYLFTILAAAILCVMPLFSQSPVRGKALFDLMRKGGLVKGGYAPNVTWLADGTGYVIAEKDSSTRQRNFYVVNPETGQKKVFIDRKTVLTAYQKCTGKKRSKFPFISFKFSKDGKKIRFGSFSKGILIYDIQSDSMTQFPKISWDGPSPELSPDWRKIAYTKSCDLYMTDISTKQEKRLTTGGSDELRNGQPDWIYPEELFQNQTFWWSPDSRKLAFLRFDEKNVIKYPILHQLKPAADLEEQFYPKAGGPNPIVTMHIVSIDSKKIVDADVGPSKDQYIISGKWLPDGSALSFQRLNRRQDKLELLFADPETGVAKVVLTDHDPYYFNINFDLTFLENKTFIWTSERSGWNEIYLYDWNGNLIKQLTDEQLPVKSIAAVDEHSGWVYFTGYTNYGLDTHLFRVRMNGEDFTELTREQGVHRIKISPFGKYFFDTFSSLNTPLKTIFRRGDGSVINTVSTADASKLESLKLIPPELVKFKAADQKTDLFGIVFKPADFDSTKKYPLFVYVYGGPWAKLVHNTFQTSGYFQSFAQLGYIVFVMDNRGTTQRGKAFETATYLKCGQVDLDDQAAGVKYLTKRPYIDGKRVGITGSSYGGYMTCMALLKKPDVYQVGVAVSSVTDWKNYDTIYTERYMQRPEDNPEGYKLGSALNYAGNLKGKLLLVHGTIDNNVHQSNTVQLIEKLIEAGKEFDLMFYPEQRHGIGGVSGMHLQKLRLEYFNKYLKNRGN